MPVTLAPRYLPPPPPEPEPPKPTDARPAPPKPATVRPPPLHARMARTARPPQLATLAAMPGPPSPPADRVSDAELAAAAGAGSGGAGQGCDMAGWLQAKLRGDARVRAAVAAAPHGQAIRVWNGDWVRHEGQDGAGLAQVREAIMWEVAWAPQACRAEPVRGLVVIALDDGAQPARLVLGRGAWRWSDLLHAHGGG